MSQNLRIGILGPVSRAVTWEKYLRPHPSVSEVVIADDIVALEGVQACILLDESSDRFDTALSLVKSGYHLFMVGRLPMNAAGAEKIFNTAEESGIVVQYSNWAVFSEGTRWMREKMPKFDLYQSVREIEGVPGDSGTDSFLGYLLEDISLAQIWSGSNLNRVHSHMACAGNGEPLSLSCFLRFENSSSASLFLLSNSFRNHHIRYATGRSGSFSADIGRKQIIFRASDRTRHEHMDFTYDEPEPARVAVTRFIKSVQLKQESDFSGYHGLQLARTISIIQEGLHR
jgi:predicted dehydrogenase